MTRLCPEKNKQPGLWYAVTGEGVELPLIDNPHQAFAENATPAKMAALVSVDFASSTVDPSISDLIRQEW